MGIRVRLTALFNLVAFDVGHVLALLSRAWGADVVSSTGRRAANTKQGEFEPIMKPSPLAVLAVFLLASFPARADANDDA